jgi:hypothetical protein
VNITAPAVLDTVERQVLSVRPEAFYHQAASFDAVARAFGDIGDRFRAALRQLEEAWIPYRADAPPPVVSLRSTVAIEVLDELRAPEFGVLLRAAGDSLATAQARLRDLRAQRAADQAAGASSGTAYDGLARLVLERVSTDFVDVGHGLLRLTGAAGPQGPVPAPGEAMALASAALLPDEAALLRDEAALLPDDEPADPPGSSAGGAAAMVLAASNPAGSNAGLSPPLTPLMPMGMGMGMGMGASMQVTRERQVDAHATADPQAWHEPDDGWDVVGRQPATPTTTPEMTPEQRALDAIDKLMRRR